MEIADARGFVFDLDGTLVRRSPAGVTPLPGAVEVLDAVRRSGRPLVVFTNASHTTPGQLAAGVRAAGLAIDDDEMLTPICSAIRVLRQDHRDRPTLAVGTPAAKRRLADAGVPLVSDADAARAEVVFTAHADEPTMALLEGAARAVLAGAAFLCANDAPAYAGADGPIISRGAMIAAAIAKAAGTAPAVVGKPSPAAVAELRDRLGVPSTATVVVGDDLGMDVALGRLGGSGTVLMRTGIGGGSVAGADEASLPDLVLDDLGQLARMLLA